MTIPAWDPSRTRAFIVCLARFEGEDEGETSFTLDDRLDIAFCEQLKELGVPEENLVFLMDDEATTDAIAEALPAHLANSSEDELLLFYYGSHGSLHPDTNEFRFASYDGYIESGWLLETIGEHFKGGQALLFADSCHSGGLAIAAEAANADIAYAVLGSTFVQQVAWSAWRFVDCLMRGFGGDARADLDGDGVVTLTEFAHYTARHMAFVAEGKPTFWADPRFGPLALSTVADGPCKDARIGQYVEVSCPSGWYKAEVLDVEGLKLFVHYTDSPSSEDAWVEASKVRIPAFPHYPVGTKVELKGSGSGEWFTGKVEASWGHLHLGRYDGYGPESDEWFGPSRIRAKA